MHEEEDHPVPLPAAQPEMGIGVHAAPRPRRPDYEIEKRVISTHPDCGCTRDELTHLIDNDRCYQKLLRSLRKRLARPIPERIAIILARGQTPRDLRWKDPEVARARNVEKIKATLFKRAHCLALIKTALEVKKIKMALRIRNIVDGKR